MKADLFQDCFTHDYQEQYVKYFDKAIGVNKPVKARPLKTQAGFPRPLVSTVNRSVVSDVMIDSTIDPKLFLESDPSNPNLASRALLESPFSEEDEETTNSSPIITLKSPMIRDLLTSLGHVRPFGISPRAVIEETTPERRWQRTPRTKRLIEIKEQIEQQRSERVREMLNREGEVITKDQPEVFDKLITRVSTYLKSKEYIRQMRVRDKVFKIAEVKLKNKDIDYCSGIRQSMRSKSEIKHRMKVDSIDPSEGPSSTSSRRNKSTFILFEQERTPVKDIMKLKIASLP